MNWIPYKESVFVLPTTRAEFAHWLKRHTKPDIVYLSEDRRRYLSLSPLHPTSDSFVIGGIVFRPDPECEDAGIPHHVEGGVIVFDMLSVGNRQEERTEVKASCRHFAAMGHFDDLQAEINETWPGTVEPTPAEKGVGKRRKRRRGAPLLEERPDADEKREKARRYVKMISNGKPKEIAAQLIGHSRKTLDRWVERLL